MKINDKIICEAIDPSTMSKQRIFGDTENNGHIIIRASENEQLLYLDGACGNEPIFLGFTKSRGSQAEKLPVEPGDFVGGIQVYARTIQGNSLGYKHEEAPLAGGLHFKVSDRYSGRGPVPTELLVALTNTDGMAIKLILDSAGNLQLSGNIKLGDLTITDTEVPVEDVSDTKKYFLVYHKGIKYAMTAFEIK